MTLRIPSLLRAWRKPLFLLTLACAAVAAAPGQTENRLPGNGRIYQLPIQKFIFASVTEVAVASGTFDIFWTEPRYSGPTRLAPKPSGFLESAYDQPVIALRDWQAYERLGAEALANYALLPGDIAFEGQTYRVVRVRDDASFYNGNTINLSTRAFVGSGHQKTIAGIVVQNGPALLLVRGIGPTLAQFGVTGVLADPFLTIYTGNTGLYFNDNWSQNSQAERIARVTTALRTFPLPAGSKDAVILADLPAGPYTIHLEGADGGVGNGMIEIYVLQGEVAAAKP
ncbi:MAG: hypothetical protein JSR82_24215 [Verrucomicrobia bacterium]|nr:hypothetical protein [Verrucomicrobiota bacterium]